MNHSTATTRATSRQGTWHSIQRVIRHGAIPAIILASLLLAGVACSGVANDREALSREIAVKIYSRDYEFLYEHAGGGLKGRYGSDEKAWATAIKSELSELSQGEVDASGAEVEISEVTGGYLAQVFVTGPSGTDVDVGIALKDMEGGTYGYCAVGVKEAGTDDDYDELYGLENASDC